MEQSAHPPHRVDRNQFWDRKILRWESARYDQPDHGYSALERLANRASASVRFRLARAREILAGACAGRSIVEIGCGSGRLAEALIRAGASSYTGYDISTVAVAEGRRRVEAAGLSSRISFVASGIEDLPSLDGDIVFSLGLLDWLSENEIARMLSRNGDAEFLHSFAENRAAVSQYLHRLYVYLAYGHRTGGYVPKYYTAAVIEKIFRHCTTKSFTLYRDRRLSFGVLVTSLPIPDED